MSRELITKLAQVVMILTSQDEVVERDTIRTIMSEEEYNPENSYEQIAQIVEECSMVSKLDTLNLWEQIAFGWVVGYVTMGYDDFALYSPHKGLYALSPIFSLEMTSSEDENPPLALSLNRKRNNITRKDFEVAMKKSGIKNKIINALFARFVAALPQWHEIIDSSQLPEEQKLRYKKIVTSRIELIREVQVS